jgi:molybdenum transport protein
MFNLSISELEKYIQDDIPYFDLTTSLQNCNGIKAQIEVFLYKGRYYCIL